MTVNNVFLVGPMGAGKSTIGRQLSHVLKKSFRDSDHEIVAHTGASIPLIFEIEGEEGFRKRESAMIDELTAMEDLVLATGGGAVLSEHNRRVLKQRGVVIYLYASLEQLFERTRRDRNRPLLQTEDPKARLEALLSQRDPLYREVADMVVHTDDRSIKSVVKEIMVRLERESKYRQE
ncbi:MAG TPA: shikimate kinase AroK [Gammaproteobacteria bacterium]